MSFGLINGTASIGGFGKPSSFANGGGKQLMKSRQARDAADRCVSELEQHESVDVERREHAR